MGRYLRWPVTIAFPMLDGETREQAEDRMIERIDPDGDTVMTWMTWRESEVTVEEDYDEP